MAASYKNFLQTCLGSSADENEEREQKLLGIEGDIFAIPEAEKEDSGRSSNDEEEGGEKKAKTMCYAMDDSDEDDGDDDDVDSEDWDLEDAYNFDPERVADLLKRGDVSQEELVETLQESMAEAMILRTINQEDQEVEAARPTLMDADVGGRMTPGATTPPAGDKDFEKSSPPDQKELADRLQQAPARAPRRSSMLRRDGAVHEAMQRSTKNHRRSIAGVASKLASEDANKDKIQLAVSNTKKRHRLSICKAAETLEVAGFGDAEDEKLVAEKLETLQKCLLEARSRHRQTVAKVARETVAEESKEEKDEKEGKGAEDGKEAKDEKASTPAPSKPKVDSNLSASAKVFTPSAKQQSIEEKIKNAVKAAHQRAKQERGQVEAPPQGYDEWGNAAGHWGTGYNQYDQGYGYNQGYDPSYNQAMYHQGQMMGQTGQCYDPSWNNQMAYAQGSQWQQQQQQGWNQGGMANGNCWMTPEGANAAYGANCYNYYGGNYAGYSQSQAAYAGQPWQQAAWGSA